MSWPFRRPPRILRGRPTSTGGVCQVGRSASFVAAPRAVSPPVAVRRCRSYRPHDVVRTLASMFDDLGGLASLVAGKTVAVKANLTGPAATPLLSRPAGQTFRCHPNVAVALAVLLDRAGARRICFLDGLSATTGLREFVAEDGWDLARLDALRAPVRLIDTRNRGGGRDYVQLRVPGGGSLFPSYWLHPAYVECDVVVSLAKLKNHTSAGVTLSCKNLFGITPTSLYGRGDANEAYVGPRLILHYATYRPPAGLPAEVASAAGCDEPGRVARHIVDALAVRPIDLAVIDGISTVAGGAGPWDEQLRFVRPGLLLAGRDPVATDAVATACMGYDPAAPAGTGPFSGDNHLALAAAAGLGSLDLKEIEPRGLPVAAARHEFGWTPAPRRGRSGAYGS